MWDLFFKLVLYMKGKDYEFSHYAVISTSSCIDPGFSYGGASSLI